MHVAGALQSSMVGHMPILTSGFRLGGLGGLDCMLLINHAFKANLMKGATCSLVYI